MIKNEASDDIRKELEEIKGQRDDLIIRNINLERENARLTTEIKELQDKIIELKDALESICSEVF